MNKVIVHHLGSSLDKIIPVNYSPSGKDQPHLFQQGQVDGGNSIHFEKIEDWHMTMMSSPDRCEDIKGEIIAQKLGTQWVF